MNRRSLSKQLATLATGIMLAIPFFEAKAQTVYNLTVGGAVGEVDGTGSSIPGFTMGASGTISVTGKLSDLVLIGSAAEVSDYSDPNAVDTFSANSGPIVLGGAEFDIIENGIGPSGTGTSDILAIVLPPNINNSVNAINFFFQPGTITTTAWNGGATTLLKDGLSGAEPGTSAYSVGYNPSGNDGAAAWITSYSFTITTNRLSLGVSLSGKNTIVSYPTNAVGFQLQSSPLLGTNSNWSTITNTAVLNGTNNTVSVPIGSGSRFFRLESTN